jgi:hypothetical protein
VGLNPVLVVHTVGGAHNDALVAVALAGAAALWVRSRPNGGRLMGPSGLAATALLTVAALIKVTAGVALLVWLATLVMESANGRRVRTGLAHVGLAVAIAAAFTVPFVDGWNTLTSLLRAAVLALFLAAFAWGLTLVIQRARPDRDAPASWGVGLLLLTLSAPYLLPWYVAWFVPLLPLVADAGIIAIGLAASGVLAVTGIPAEPGPDPGLWNGMILAVHYVAGPVMLALFGAALRRITRP